MKSTVQNTVAAAPFALALPAIFDIKPEFVVPLPAKRVAHIYAAAQRQGNNLVPTAGWRVVAMHNGAECPRVGYRSHGEFFSEALDVKLHLENLAKQLVPKKRVMKHAEDFSDD